MDQVTPTERMAAGYARAPLSPRQQRLADAFRPNEVFDRALAGDAEVLSAITSSPALRMQLGMYQQQKAAYQALYGGNHAE